MDYLGKTFGQVTIICDAGKTDDGKKLVTCRCLACGREFTAHLYNVVRGRTRSCGCVRGKNISETKTKHGDDKHNKRSVLYRKWADMKTRCTNPNSDSYPSYGEKGIRVCDEWMHSYEAFKEWALSNGYHDGLSIERISVDDDYCPDNCKFVELNKQQRNKKNTVYFDYNGDHMCIADLVEKYRPEWTTGFVWGRIQKGWDIKRAIEEPKHNTCAKNKKDS